MLRELGCSAEHTFRRSGATQWFGFCGTEFDTGFAGNSARRDCNAAGWNRDAANYATDSERTRIAFFVQRNSKYHRSGIDISRHTDSGWNYAALYDQPQHAK